MTTIAVNTEGMACDLQFVHSSGLKFKGSTKILELPTSTSVDMFGFKKAFVGFAGNADIWGQMVSFLLVPEGKPPRCRDIEFLMLNEKGHIYHGTNLKNWLRIQSNHFAIGSGMQYAIAAMDAGKTPREACVIAAKYDVSTGMGSKYYSLK